MTALFGNLPFDVLACQRRLAFVAPGLRWHGPGRCVFSIGRPVSRLASVSVEPAAVSVLMPDTVARRKVVSSVVERLDTALPFGPSDTPPTVRPGWIEGMVERFGFSAPQAAFTSHVASLGGLFTTRQAELWLAGNWTEWSLRWEPSLARRARVRFLQPLFCSAGQRSAVARAFSLSDDRIFTHISNRSAYAVLEHPNSKYRRLPRLPGILQRLTAYDYVLEHSSLRWYALTRAKLDLMKQLGVARPDLPQRTYHSRYDAAPATPDMQSVQYFVDHFPIGISPGWRVVFVFVAEPSRPRNVYRHILGHYRPLFRVLRARGLRVSVVALTTPGCSFPASERARLAALPSPPTSLDRRRLFLHVEAQVLRRALREKDLSIISTYGGADAVEQHLEATRGKLVDLRGVGSVPTDVFFWNTDRLCTSRWSRTPGTSSPARPVEASS